MKLLEKFSDCQLLKEDSRILLVNDCIFIILAPTHSVRSYLPTKNDVYNKV